jgi:hypothetical protein
MHIITNELDVYLVIGLRGRGRGWFIHSFLFVIGSDKKGGRWFDSCNIFVGRKLCRSGIETNEIESCAARVDTMAAACPKSDKKWKKRNPIERGESKEEKKEIRSADFNLETNRESFDQETTPDLSGRRSR